MSDWYRVDTHKRGWRLRDGLKFAGSLAVLALLLVTWPVWVLLIAGFVVWFGVTG